MSKKDVLILSILMCLLIFFIIFIVIKIFPLTDNIIQIETMSDMVEDNSSSKESYNSSITEEVSTYSNEESINESSIEDISQCEESNIIEESDFEISYPEIEELSIEIEESTVEEILEESAEETSIEILEETSEITLMQLNSNSDNIQFEDRPVYDSKNIPVATVRVFIYEENYAYNYLNTVYNCFIRHKTDESIPVAGMLAQAFNEGGAGRDGVYLNSNNCFGIKAHCEWEGKVYSQKAYGGNGQIYISYEEAVKAGVPKLSLYRVYNNIDESVADYIKFIKEYYTDALWKNSLPCSKSEVYSFEFNYCNYSEKEIKNSYLGNILWSGYGEKDAINKYAYLIKKFNLYSPSELKNKIRK